ncbi:MAG TPA: ATP synthase subunit I [Thiobacillaceae bacterium]|nr:ATP synthase subunit I [Thiobacillaceae bacterium]
MFRPTFRVAASQIALCSVAGGVAYGMGGRSAAVSAAAGGAVAMLGTLVLILREKQSERHFGWGAERNLLQFYRSGLERFVLVAALLGALFVHSGSVPLAVLMGFITAQSAWLLATWKP